MLSLLMQLLIEMWWALVLIIAALVYAARVDVRYTKNRDEFMDDIRSSMDRCEYDRDTF